jgi:hypothetical protein
MNSNLTQAETLKIIKEVLLELLGENGLNTLGKYDIFDKNRIINQIPSIEIRYPFNPRPINKKIKPYSGIEAIIWQQPDIVPKFYYNSGFLAKNYYTVSLDDYHPTNGLLESCHEILNCGDLLTDHDSLPPIKEAIVNEQGITPARQNIFIYTVTVRSPYYY